ncbi:butyrophilin subfamily 2 member A1-like isoform X2 [Dicentrarchus labrax]|uniref:butyrophilin subfamily 2 member A1-like isoform X2 n=1 Tax=Dicentrarchus labrax TaxID=13489 RepID=UPI0021F61020|nr:butyrophilin subfamily 2 member A1-like isoform X2 [Dicentrarchus labrax]
MLPMTGPGLQSPLRTISVLLVHFLLAHLCRGQSQLIGSPQPIVATIGADIILPCHLEPAVDVTAKTFEWTRPDLNPGFVYLWPAGQDFVNVKNPAYKGRTLIAGEVKHGNISLKLSKVKPSDEGRYRCYIPDLTVDSFTELVVVSDTASLPDISLSGIDRNRGALILNCDSNSWYPEPEVVWLDGEGNLLSAGPTETVRGPDDLYTVSSRVTVEKRHSNNFTCRVQQKGINQTRETHIYVIDDFFEIHSSSAVPIIVGLVVCLAVCIVCNLLLVFFVLKIKKSHGEKNCSKENITAERETLMTDRTVKSKRSYTSSASQSSTTAPVVEVDLRGKYIRLRNWSNEEQQLGGWRLEVQLNETESITHTFENSFILQAGNTVTLRAPGYGCRYDDIDLVWKDLKLSPGDILQVALISSTGDIHHNSYQIIY